jgi:hypothetical protein
MRWLPRREARSSEQSQRCLGSNLHFSVVAPRRSRSDRPVPREAVAPLCRFQASRATRVDVSATAFVQSQESAAGAPTERFAESAALDRPHDCIRGLAALDSAHRFGDAALVPAGVGPSVADVALLDRLPAPRARVQREALVGRPSAAEHSGLNGVSPWPGTSRWAVAPRNS